MTKNEYDETIERKHMTDMKRERSRTWHWRWRWLPGRNDQIKKTKIHPASGSSQLVFINPASYRIFQKDDVKSYSELSRRDAFL